MGLVTNDDRDDWREAWALFPGDVAYVWYGSIHGSVVEDSLRAAGFVLRSQIVWVKSNLIISRGHYHWQHETCWYVVRRGRTAHWAGDHKQSTVWQLTHMVSETGHGTQKPPSLGRGHPRFRDPRYMWGVRVEQGTGVTPGRAGCAGATSCTGGM